ARAGHGFARAGGAGHARAPGTADRPARARLTRAFKRSAPRADPAPGGRVYDGLVIGAGPAGWAAALQAAKLGLSGGLIEKVLRLGGACVHTGTLPSKSLRHVILELMTLRRAAHLGVHSTLLRPLKISDLMNPTASVIDAHERTIRAFLERNRVEV